MGQALCICSPVSITIENKKYYFVQKLAEGGFSYVDKVEGAKDGCYYAVKRILCHDREGRQEAQTEVEMHQLFNHPNILTLVAHTFTDCEGKTEAWLLLPYFRKGTLWTHLENLRDKARFLPEYEVLEILHGICSGKAMHDKGYAHRYFLPMCIDITHLKQCIAKIKYASKPKLSSTLVQSLGCVLYCMMMLEGPYDMIFQKGDSVALAVQNPVSIPQPCRYSQSLQTLLSSIMVSNPLERPHINWVLDQVQALQAQTPVGSSTSQR
uniref:non-specific serine/threonine protein kinase n=1 Tax=Tetraodon nigroviridis TaxID=99883 RepID=H3C5G8_TETNG